MLTILVVPIIFGCTDHSVGIVENPDQCEAQWEARLKEHRRHYAADEGWHEQFVLDANKGGDFKMAQRYMEEFGWFSAATEDVNDLTLYFMPDTSPHDVSGDWRAAQRPKPILADGLKRACHAAWISKVPFVRVTRRGEQGEDVLYSVTTENMPVEDF